MNPVEYEGDWLAMGELANWYSAKIAIRIRRYKEPFK